LSFNPYDENLLVFDEESKSNEESEGQLSLLQKYIYELKEIDKSIMLLYLDDKSYKEISEITGISESNVGTKLNRIKTDLQSKFSNN
jgi:RNA polymerase sigma-70 factor (ECF subfamily)